MSFLDTSLSVSVYQPYYGHVTLPSVSYYYTQQELENLLNQNNQDPLSILNSVVQTYIVTPLLQAGSTISKTVGGTIDFMKNISSYIIVAIVVIIIILLIIKIL